MFTQEISNGLFQLGFEDGWVVQGDAIILWERPEPQPTIDAILEAAKLYVEPEPTVAEKLASVGLSLEELKAAILGGN